MEGQHPWVVAHAMGINLRTVFDGSHVPQRRLGKLNVRRKRRRPKLDAQTLKCICDTVLSMSPVQLKFPFALWTAAMVSQIIAKAFRGTSEHSSVCRQLTQMGMSAQRLLCEPISRTRKTCASVEAGGLSEVETPGATPLRADIMIG